MTRSEYSGQIVWVVGASSGIGAALATELAVRGAVLALSSRQQAELDKLQKSLGAEHKVFPLDVTDAGAVQNTAHAIRAAFGRIDRVIIMAAAYLPMRLDALDPDLCREMVEVNIIGALNLVHAVLPIFAAQAKSDRSRNAQIALCGSVAGYIGLPGGQPYSATKAAIINLAESLQSECARTIDVKLINPGFVRTPLTAKNNFKMPMIIEPQQAAIEIADGLLTERFEIHFPKKFTRVLKLLRLLPYALSLRITKNFIG
ncbi:MAG: SDR family NAD(P)-dependent oxidoreductase [Pseudomonadota bacterium]|nr:SDR family NAD(P)-dependent oxidoreductase [Pseudomonadota bacterium]